MPQYRIKIVEEGGNISHWSNASTEILHRVSFFVNRRKLNSGFWKTSKKPIYKFSFYDEKLHKDLIDLQKVADGREGETIALLYINHEHIGIKFIARTMIGC